MSCRKLLMAPVLCTVLLLLSLISFSQGKVITGKVTDAKDGSGIGGATVMVKGTTNATQSKLDGTFTLDVTSGGNTLVFSAIGYTTQEISIEGKSTVDVSMGINTASLGEVVVIGYGTARKKDLTGSITTVTTKDFVKGPITTPEQLITGKVAGVQINTYSGEPGVGSRIRIRGGTSAGAGFGASNDPLIVIDGVPLDNNSIAGAPNPLALINPNEIESFNVLKDASAAAIYGSRAANGVIIITTKKGRKSKKVNVSFSTLNAISTRTGSVDVLSAADFRSYVNANGNAGDADLLGAESTDWQDQIYRSAFSTDNNISLTGGIKFLPYRLSLGFLNQDGILKRSNIKRYSVGLNLSPKFFGDHLSVNTNLKYTRSDNFFANTGAIGSAVYFDPTQPIYGSDNKYGGYFEWIDPDDNKLNGLAGKNPLGLLYQNENVSDVDRFLGNIQFDYKLHFLPELRFNLNLGLDRSTGQGSLFVPAEAASDSIRGGIFREYKEDKYNKLLDFYLNYVKNIPAIRSRLDVMGGYSYQDWERKNPSFPDYKADKVTEYAQAGTPFQAQNTLISFYGRINYTLLEKYLVTFTMRRDGSSKFNKDNRWGNFPSAALAWNVSDENFMKNQGIFSHLKLRLGWGITGQQDGIYEYGYQPNYFYGDSAAQYQFGNKYYVVVRPDAYDANLKWEETESRNIGLEMSFLKGRLSFNLDYYTKETKDLLARVPLAAGTNFSDKVTTNVGSIKNRGLEAVLNAEVIKKSDFTLDLGYNLTWIIKSEITKLQLVNNPEYLGTLTGGGGGFNNVQIHSIGYRPSTFFLFRQVYDHEGKPIEGLYEDVNGDGVINDFDKRWVKNPDPNVYMGLSANASYRKLSAGFVMRASFGNYMYNGVKVNSGFGNNILTDQDFLRNGHYNVLETGFSDLQTFSDYYLENASFLRMDNIYLGYDFGKPFRNKDIRLRGSLNCQNVFVITKYDGLDPEINDGIDNSIYPRPRMFALGLNLDF